MKGIAFCTSAGEHLKDDRDSMKREPLITSVPLLKQELCHPRVSGRGSVQGSCCGWFLAYPMHNRRYSLARTCSLLPQTTAKEGQLRVNERQTLAGLSPSTQCFSLATRSQLHSHQLPGSRQASEQSLRLTIPRPTCLDSGQIHFHTHLTTIK